jgi:hypothetical protein
MTVHGYLTYVLDRMPSATRLVLIFSQLLRHKIVTAAIAAYAILSTLRAETGGEESQNSTLKVFILAGQSNASGRASWKALDPKPSIAASGVLYFYDTDTTGAFNGLRSSEGELVPLGPASNDRFGPEIGLSHRLHELGQNRQVIIKFGRGGTNLHSDWNMSATEGKLLYNQLLTKIKRVLQKLDELGTDYSVEGFFLDAGRK